MKTEDLIISSKKKAGYKFEKKKKTVRKQKRDKFNGDLERST